MLTAERVVETRRRRLGGDNLYTREAPDHELVRADDFLLEALGRWQGRWA